MRPRPIASTPSTSPRFGRTEDYPLIEVGRMTLDRNPTDYHTEIEQAAFEPNNLVPGIGPSPDKMLLARLFSYADAHRARMGVNYKQIPVNQPKVPVHSYSKDGLMRVQNVSDPVYAPNSKGGPKADPTQYPQVEVWEASGEFVHAAYTKRKDDDDFGQPGTFVRKVMDNAATRPAGLQRRRSPEEGSERARTGARVRVLAKYRPSRWRPYRQGHQRRTDGRGIAGMTCVNRPPIEDHWQQPCRRLAHSYSQMILSPRTRS